MILRNQFLLSSSRHVVGRIPEGEKLTDLAVVSLQNSNFVINVQTAKRSESTYRPRLATR